MRKSIAIPDNLQMNFKSTLNFYKNIFNYKDTLIIIVDRNEFFPVLHSNTQNLSSVLIEQANLPENNIIKNDHDKNEDVKKLCEHFSVQALFSFNKKYFIGVNSVNKNLTNEEKKIGGFFAQYFENLIKNEELVGSLESYSKRMQQMLSEISTLHEITRALDSGENLDSLLKYIMGKCKLIMNAEAASLMLVITETNELEFKIVLGPKSEEVKPFRLPIGKGISGWVAKTGKPVLIPDVYKDDRFDPSFDKKSGFKTTSMLCVPMLYKNKTIGVMTVLNRRDQFPFSENDQVLLTIFASQAALAIENARLLIKAIEKERLDKELQVASDIQNLLIPQELPKISNLDIAATYLPCLEISGDFYDIIPISKNRYVFVVADVSGKGIPGALVVSNMQATLRAYLEHTSELLAIVSKLNESIIRQTTSDRFITFFIGIYDMEKLTFEFINAGHNPPLHYKNNGEIDQLQKGGIFIGLMPFNYESETVHLHSGDILLFYTDGLVEAMNQNEVEFGEQKVKDIIINNAHKNSNEIQQIIIDEVKTHVSDNKLDDDFTLVIAKVQ